MGPGLSVFAVVFLAELPDKTSLAALTMASQHRALPVWLGAVIAFAFQTALAVGLGSFASHVPHAYVRWGSGLLFLAFAFLYGLHARPSRSGQGRVPGDTGSREGQAGEDADEAEEAARIAAVRARTRRVARLAVLQAAIVIFVAEFGDLTQFALLALSARLARPALVFGAGWLALAAAALIATTVGERLGALLTPRRMRIVASMAMGVMGVATLAGWGFA